MLILVSTIEMSLSIFAEMVKILKLEKIKALSYEYIKLLFQLISETN